MKPDTTLDSFSITYPIQKQYPVSITEEPLYQRVFKPQ